MRLFVGLELPWELRQRIGLLVGAGIPGARWVPPENYHITLRFIGEAPRYMAEEIDRALAALKAPAFRSDLGRYRHASPRPVAATRCGLVSSVAKSSTGFRPRSRQHYSAADWRPERRRFQPHVTLARLDGNAEAKLAAFVQAHNLFRAGPIPAEHFTLFSSILGKDQPVYTAEVEYPLLTQAE